MCFYMQMKDPKVKLEDRFKAKVAPQMELPQSDIFNGFEHPNIGLITDQAPDTIQCDFSWGLLPHWAKDTQFRKNTLNARIETLAEKPSFREVIQNRCLIPANAFYDWHWLDEKGKNKQRYIIYGPDELFAFAGLYSYWTHPETGSQMGTYTVLTTTANATMSFIHNSKKRMPIILKKEDEQRWLHHELDPSQLAFPYEVPLLAFPG
ncbi:MAG: SOS response-associated peptidase, partial [Flavobacterium stagni]